MIETRVDRDMEAILGIEHEHTAGELCVVSHPDAGGVCGRPATMEVYELPFCPQHGAECASGAVEELSHAAYAYLEVHVLHAVDHWFIGHVLGGALEEAKIPALGDRGWLDYRKWADPLAVEAFPLKDELIDPYTRDFGRPFVGADDPVSHWAMRRGYVYNYMNQAYGRIFSDLVRELEPLRERMSAQYAYALAMEWEDRGRPE